MAVDESRAQEVTSLDLDPGKTWVRFQPALSMCMISGQSSPSLILRFLFYKMSVKMNLPHGVVIMKNKCLAQYLPIAIVSERMIKIKIT